jgi:hypothetical protein
MELPLVNRQGTLLVKGRSGLGNRMICALTGILYARLTGRKLIIDWRDGTFSYGEENVFPLLFECPLARPVAEIPDTDSVAPSIWRGRLSMTSWALQQAHPEIKRKDNRRTTSIDQTRLDYSEELLVLWHFGPSVGGMMRRNRERVAALYEQRTAPELLRSVVSTDLQLVHDIRERVDRFSAEHFAGEEVAGVHVRYSDRRVPVGAIQRRLEALLDRRPGLRIFLATDNRDIRDLFARSYGQVLTTPHWYPEPGLTVHHNEACPDRHENARTGLVDLYLLAACDHLVADTSSSFAQVAWLLSNRGGESLHDVRRTASLEGRLRGIVRSCLPGGREPCAPW